MSEENKKNVEITPEGEISVSAPPQGPVYNKALLSQEVIQSILEQESKAMKCFGKDKIKLLHDDLLNESSTLEVRTNFACVICGNIPLAPVK